MHLISANRFKIYQQWKYRMKIYKGIIFFFHKNKKNNINYHGNKHENNEV